MGFSDKHLAVPALSRDLSQGVTEAPDQVRGSTTLQSNAQPGCRPGRADPLIASGLPAIHKRLPPGRRIGATRGRRCPSWLIATAMALSTFASAAPADVRIAVFDDHGRYLCTNTNGSIYVHSDWERRCAPEFTAVSASQVPYVVAQDHTDQKRSAERTE